MVEVVEEEVEATEEEAEAAFEAAFEEFSETLDPAEEEEEALDEVVTAPDDTDPDPVTEAPDPYEGMTDEVKAKFIALEGDRDGLQHTIDSDDGRVRAFQLKVNGLENEIQTIRKGDTAGPSQTQIADAMKGSDADWDGFSQSYPDVASAIDKRMAAMGNRVDEAVASTLAPVKEASAKTAATEAESANKERVDAVSELYPTWTAEVKKTEFTNWLADQSKGVSDLSLSDDERDASTLIGLYDSHLVSEGHPSIRKQPDPNESGVTEVTAKAVPTELEARRAQQLKDGESVVSRKSGVTTDGPELTEYEAAFEVFAKRTDAQNRA